MVVTSSGEAVLAVQRSRRARRLRAQRSEAGKHRRDSAQATSVASVDRHTYGEVVAVVLLGIIVVGFLALLIVMIRTAAAPARPRA
jgi:hypothetical protein